MKLLLGTLLLLGSGTCGRDGGNTRTFAQPIGSDRCEAVVAAYCDRCDESTVWTQEECLDRDEVDVDCEATINLSSKYEDCMEALEEGQCADTLPSVCWDVILVDP
jgi:hypothetical protein